MKNKDQVKWTWAKRSPEWIKENPGKGTMYKIMHDGVAEDVALSIMENPSVDKITCPIDLSDIGVYAIICRAANSVYIGQSKNMGVRMRNHKMKITGSHVAEETIYKRMQEDFKKYGIDAFEFVRVHRLEEDNVAKRVALENDTMIEYFKKGYFLYNSAVKGFNFHVRPELFALFTEISKQSIDDPSLIDRIKATITTI